MSRIQGGLTVKPKILALHGRGSNADVTVMQLDNLGLTSKEYDISVIDGPIIASQAGPGLSSRELDNLFSGPWYSWLPDSDYSRPNDETGSILLTAIANAAQYVLNVVEKEGPFDAVYGFSQGGVIATLVNRLAHDDVLFTSLRDALGQSEPFIQPTEPPFRTEIIACAAAPLTFLRFSQCPGLALSPTVTPIVQTIHLIGRQDNNRIWSEALAVAMDSPSNHIYYLDDGHEISRQQRQNTTLATQLGVAIHAAPGALTRSTAKDHQTWLPSGELSARIPAADQQIVSVKQATERLPDTILDVLSVQPRNAPLLRLARTQDPMNFTSYGQLLAFSQAGGEGDLRRLGVHPGEAVAYLAPAGGSAVAAAAFLSIAAQTCAVPFSANMSEKDALTALGQYGVKHMVMFDGVSAQGVQSAFERYASAGNARLHRASAQDNPSPGLFCYLESLVDIEMQPPLVNPADGHGLLLRTSGTTSQPKVVPLRQKDLVINGAILADSIGISADDVTYSVMPLDHIGGISASILSSIAVGAAITCDDFYYPQGMVEALVESNPQPTWYSAVPTIHNATVRHLQDNADEYLDQDGVWGDHHLRMIRSGAAALKEADRSVLEATFGCDVVPTYSMSELMPIAQPSRNEGGWMLQPGSVGVPVAASIAIVDPITLRPLPFGEEGEVAISGATVFDGYLNNPEANQQSRFLMVTPQDQTHQSWFLTGDIGEVDRIGTLTLRGRLKELIKRGGEQVAPAEVEEILTQHPSVETAVCFSVPSEVYGEEVGCALVMEAGADAQSLRTIESEMKALLRKKGLAAHKFPSVWTIAEHDDLPMTASRKLIRNGLAEILGVTSREVATATSDSVVTSTNSGSQQSAPSSFKPVELLSKPKIDWETLAGFRFLLACYVMFMHIGSNESWGAVANLRQFPWHVHTFFAVAGFSLAIIMPTMIMKKMSFITARISGMYPLYFFAVIIALGNLLVSCQPSTFSSVFHWVPMLEDSSKFFCQGTPLLHDSWLANVLLTFGIYLTGLQATPLWGASWFLGFYLWFISMYFQCLIIFPMLYNALYKHRGNTKKLLMFTALGLGVNLLVILAFWYGYAIDAAGYGFFDSLTGLKTIPTESQIAVAGKDNAVILGFYLFSPFWIIYFAAGMCAAFVYDAIRPSEQRRSYIWGYIADTITLIMIVVSVAHIAQGYVPHDASMAAVSLDPFFMRPEAANTFADPATVNRIWDNIYGRLFAPITLLWIFALCTGKGVTARVLRLNPIVNILAPTAYACFLFHQMVGQWYYAATRNGEWWNWWAYQKDFYWFSPQPVPVEWYEYFYVIGLVVIFSKIVQPVDPLLRRGFATIVGTIKGHRAATENTETSDKDTTTRILDIVKSVVGMEVEPEQSLDECGLASLGVVQFSNTLEAEFSTATHPIKLAVADIMTAADIHGIAVIVDNARREVREQLSPSKAGTPQMA
ncbi:acyl-CoA synthetase (AMP-forming)/AMP-acid ligase II [Sinobacterium caligoides]|uniref:Acyl-CoA synthetase (AMP-forming)/AMP-acid ligase II n=1 Tax=Sinobacterium caligoides TaxID=933926 RepID=A0A3N2DPE2_9GAMM|nr:AMP-binding protein [Sinobacterium caligoides]ROS01646.1 acyl-CoA synthetase (AMP-forming)/AMP-acid ligase II [Sinobacterium caligoides]